MYVIVALPEIPPVRRPDVAFTDATLLLLLLHVPPPVGLPSIWPEPEHTCRLPVIASGTAFTVTILVCIQPVADSIYVI